ncbi:hypothetical protein QBC44DRAFT_365981 [Cladorrhinum sp. PSN332]|nr:hypothetical protein QBC44DRAFT_365981 [Cladorrhinum sp. PSN332]
MLLSVLCILTITAILKACEGKKPRSIFGGITLNAIVSVLSTISKSSLIFSVSAAIGQFKRDWYETESRRLYDLEIFDEASRGPLGAAKLLLFRRQTMASVASIGDINLILALVVDPFVQQVVGFSSKDIVTQNQMVAWSSTPLSLYTSTDILVESKDVWTERLTRLSFYLCGDVSGD